MTFLVMTEHKKQRPDSYYDLSSTAPNKPRREKTGLRGFRQEATQTDLCSHRRKLESWNFG